MFSRRSGLDPAANGSCLPRSYGIKGQSIRFQMTIQGAIRGKNRADVLGAGFSKALPAIVRQQKTKAFGQVSVAPGVIAEPGRKTIRIDVAQDSAAVRRGLQKCGGQTLSRCRIHQHPTLLENPLQPVALELVNGTRHLQIRKVGVAAAQAVFIDTFIGAADANETDLGEVLHEVKKKFGPFSAM